MGACQLAETGQYVDDLKAAPPHPRGHFGYAARICATDYSLESRQQKVYNRVEVPFGGHPSATHLVGYRSGGPAPAKQIDHQVSGIRGYMNDPFQEQLGLRSVENLLVWKQGHQMAL